MSKQVVDFHIPKGFTRFDVRLDGEDKIPSRIAKFLQFSPERTVYHDLPYLSFAARENGSATLLVIERDGQPSFAIPIHPVMRGGFSTGYSGVLFPETETERQLRTRLDDFREFVLANPRMKFEVIQSRQCLGWQDEARRTLIASTLLSLPNFYLRPCFTRIVDLESLTSTGAIDLTNLAEPTWDQGSLTFVDAKIRNQIRNVINKGVRLRVSDLRNLEDRSTFFNDFLPVHHASWHRTGMTPHGEDYLTGLTDAVIGGGGIDLGITVLLDREPLACVNIHVFGGVSIYWSGCSSARGKSMNANPLALFGGMIAARDAGATMFELGRFFASETSQKELAITRYKDQFGGQLHEVLVMRRDSLSSEVARRLKMAVRKMRTGVVR